MAQLHAAAGTYFVCEFLPLGAPNLPLAPLGLVIGRFLLVFQLFEILLISQTLFLLRLDRAETVKTAHHI